MRKPKILIIDDDLISRTTLEVPLVNEGFDVYLAINGKDGLDNVYNVIPDLIILDVMMPDMDGYEVCRSIRSNAKVAEIPIVMITGLDDLDSRLQALEAGADDIIQKPFNHIEMLAKVRAITRLNRYRRLIDERTRFEWVVEQSEDGYVLVDNQDHILYANPQAQIYLGINRDYQNIKNLQFFPIVNSKYNCEPKENWTNWTEQYLHNTHYLERYLVLPETETSNAIWLQVITLGQAAGTDLQYLIRLRDLTPFMVSQRDIITFHHILNHKLRTPLSTLKISIEMLANETIELPQDEFHQIAKTALQSVKRLRNDILNVLRFLGAPNQDEIETTTCLAQIYEKVSLIEKSLKLKPVNISIDDTIKQTLISFSEKELELLLWELLENTKKFHPIKNPEVEIIAQKLDDSVQLQIMDNGGTLTPDQISKVWLPYYQGEKYFTGEVNGMGLGLSLVSTIIWQKGGTCTIYNRNPAPGIVVELTIPISSIK